MKVFEEKETETHSQSLGRGQKLMGHKETGTYALLPGSASRGIANRKGNGFIKTHAKYWVLGVLATTNIFVC